MVGCNDKVEVEVKVRSGININKACVGEDVVVKSRVWNSSKRGGCRRRSSGANPLESGGIL